MAGLVFLAGPFFLAGPGSALVALCAFSPPLLAADPAAPPVGGNILIIVADDLGVDNVGVYGEGADLPPTPNIDALAAGGMLFRHAYASPTCTPSRASLMTGRLPFNTGLGSGLQPWEGQALDPDAVTLPKLIDSGSGQAYALGAFGKWHLSTALVGGDAGPNLAGWHHFDGTLYNLYQGGSLDYYTWRRVVNGQASTHEGYATIATTDAALEWIDGAQQPWLTYVAYNAPHDPFQIPPASLYTVDTTGGHPQSNPRPIYRAMVEALDTEIGRLLGGIPAATLQDTTVIFLGDNGSPSSVVTPPFVTGQAKGTVYEGGVNVPLIVNGPAVSQAGSESEAFVHVVDLLPTIASLAGVNLSAAHPVPKLDGFDLLPLLTNSHGAWPREYAFSEIAYPNGPAEVCGTNLGFAGPGVSQLTVCGKHLSEGQTATLLLKGAPPNTPTVLVSSLNIKPIPVVGGTLVPVIPALSVTIYQTDSAGRVWFTLDGGTAPFGGPYPLVMQFVTPTPEATYHFSNAISVDLEDTPFSRRMIRGAQYKLMRLKEVMDGTSTLGNHFFDLRNDPFELVDLLAGGAANLTPAQNAALITLLAEMNALLER